MFALIRKVFKAALVLVTLSVVFLLGWAGNYLTSQLWHASQAVCYVQDAVVVACQREEQEDAYIWNVVAIRNEGSVYQEVILIKHKVPKNKFGYFYAF